MKLGSEPPDADASSPPMEVASNQLFAKQTKKLRFIGFSGCTDISVSIPVVEVTRREFDREPILTDAARCTKVGFGRMLANSMTRLNLISQTISSAVLGRSLFIIDCDYKASVPLNCVQ